MMPGSHFDDRPGGRPTRRRVLTGTMATAGATVALDAIAALKNVDDVPPWQKAPGADVTIRPYGVASRYEAGVIRRERTGGSSYPTRQAAVGLTPLQDLNGIITPNGLRYERRRAGERQRRRA